MTIAEKMAEESLLLFMKHSTDGVVKRIEELIITVAARGREKAKEAIRDHNRSGGFGRYGLTAEHMERALVAIDANKWEEKEA